MKRFVGTLLFVCFCLAMVPSLSAQDKDKAPPKDTKKDVKKDVKKDDKKKPKELDFLDDLEKSMKRLDDLLKKIAFAPQKTAVLNLMIKSTQLLPKELDDWSEQQHEQLMKLFKGLDGHLKAIEAAEKKLDKAAAEKSVAAAEKLFNELSPKLKKSEKRKEKSDKK